MNFMPQVIRQSAEKQSAKVKHLAEQREKQKISVVNPANFTLRTPTIVYYLNCVPSIPKGRTVVSKWHECLTMYVNWSNDPTITSADQLKRQYGFVFRVENENPVGYRKEKDPENVAVIFNNAEKCQKHLNWFNSCFVTDAEVKEETAKVAKERSELRKKTRKEFLGLR